LGHPGLRAEALLAFAGLDGEEPAAAQAAREEALAQAVAAGDRDLEATAQLRLLVAASERVDARAIDALLPVARAAIARPEVPPAIRLAFADAEATALVRLAAHDQVPAACERLAALEPAPQPLATRCRCLEAAETMSKDAVAPCQAAVAAARAAYGDHHPALVDRLTTLANALTRTGDTDRALAEDAEALAIQQAAAGPDSVEVADVLSVSAARFIDAGRLADAKAALERALAIRRRVDGASPSRRQGHAEQKLGEVLVRLGKLDEGLAHADRGMQILEATIPADNPDLAKIYAVYGNINLAAERWPVVDRAMHRCAEVTSRSLGDHHPLRAICLLGLAQAELAEGHAADAATDARVALDLATELKLNPINLGAAEGSLGRALGESGDRAGARLHLDKAIAIFAAVGPGAADNLDDARRQRRRF
ncbi:MAG TPA: tetratricopeptide repeat protein, partial [Kofleriaceae bacterium]|nr:tetratricopeptide repeat protein [Kofleriaceae bacterium]